MFNLSLKILIVEGNDLDFNGLTRIIGKSFKKEIKFLRQVDYQSITSANLREIDALIGDLNVSGVQDIESIKELVKTIPEKPIIVLTENEKDDLFLNLISEGVSDILLKSEALQNGSSLIVRSIVNSIERKKLQNALNEKSQFKSRFLANMSHEIRTPLGVISGLVEVIKERTKEANLIHHVDLLSTSIDTVLNLVNNIVDLSKIEADEIHLSPIKFKPVRLLEDVNDLLCSTAFKKGLDFYFIVESELPETVYLDYHRLRQVLINLVSNAFKFTSDGYISLSVSFDFEKNSLIYKVQDSGLGIPNKKIARIFKEFKQLDNSTTRKFGGAGLGLAISKRLLDMMDATITADSVPGHGTEFTVTVPISEEDPKIEDYYDLGFSLSHFKILVVDDNLEELLILKRYFEKAGAQIELCPSGGKAIERFDKDKLDEFSYVFIDVKMKNLGGIETFEKLREKDPNLNKKTIFFLPSIARKKDVELMETINPKAFYYKPIKKKELIELFEGKESKKPTKGLFESKQLKGKILMAEDFEDNVIVIKEFLRDQNIDLTVVENGKLAIEKAKTEDFDVILMDIQMAVMDGMQATKRIRRMEKLGKEEPRNIIALTANAMKEEIEHYIEIGCSECLVKPVKKSKLLKTLSNYLEIEDSTMNEVKNYKEEIIPESFISYIPKYIERREVDLNHLDKALEEKDFEVIRKICHRILGSAETYGLVMLDQIMKEIHREAKENSIEQMGEKLVKLRRYLS